MQVQEFECQLARGQISRYLAGDSLSPTAVKQLESHIADCPNCQEVLSKRKEALMAMISEAKEAEQTVSAVVETEAAQPKPNLVNLLKKHLPTAKPAEASKPFQQAKPATFWKPLSYSLALGAVLIGMSYMSRNMGSMLGPKLSETAKTPPAATTIPKPAPAVVTIDNTDTAIANADTAEATAEDFPADEALPVTAPEVTGTAQPIPPVTHRPQQTHSTHRAQSRRTYQRTHAKRAARPSSEIRVYNPEN